MRKKVEDNLDKAARAHTPSTSQDHSPHEWGEKDSKGERGKRYVEGGGRG